MLVRLRTLPLKTSIACPESLYAERAIPVAQGAKVGRQTLRRRGVRVERQTGKMREPPPPARENRIRTAPRTGYWNCKIRHTYPAVHAKACETIVIPTVATAPLPAPAGGFPAFPSFCSKLLWPELGVCARKSQPNGVTSVSTVPPVRRGRQSAEATSESLRLAWPRLRFQRKSLRSFCWCFFTWTSISAKAILTALRTFPPAPVA
jgi:hypothetical protein